MFPIGRGGNLVTLCNESPLWPLPDGHLSMVQTSVLAVHECPFTFSGGRLETAQAVESDLRVLFSGMVPSH